MIISGSTRGLLLDILSEVQQLRGATDTLRKEENALQQQASSATQPCPHQLQRYDHNYTTFRYTHNRPSLPKDTWNCAGEQKSVPFPRYTFRNNFQPPKCNLAKLISYQQDLTLSAFMPFIVEDATKPFAFVRSVVPDGVKDYQTVWDTVRLIGLGLNQPFAEMLGVAMVPYVLTSFFIFLLTWSSTG